MDPLLAIIVVCVVLWALGLGFHLGGGLIHVLIVVAIVVLVVRLLQQRSP